MKNSNKELAQLLISGKRKTITADNAKHATAIRVAGHRLGYVLRVSSEDHTVRLTDTKVSSKSKPKPKKAKKKSLSSMLE